MSMCSCDGPPHTYSPSWCGAGVKSDSGPRREPINKQIAIAELELRVARLRAQAEAEDR